MLLTIDYSVGYFTCVGQHSGIPAPRLIRTLATQATRHLTCTDAQVRQKSRERRRWAQGFMCEYRRSLIVFKYCPASNSVVHYNSGGTIVHYRTVFETVWQPIRWGKAHGTKAKLAWLMAKNLNELDASNRYRSILTRCYTVVWWYSSIVTFMPLVIITWPGICFYLKSDTMFCISFVCIPSSWESDINPMAIILEGYELTSPAMFEKVTIKVSYSL